MRVNNQIWKIAQKFQTAEIIDIQTYGNGNINQTFLVTLSSTESFILQRINQQVFSQPKSVIDNMCRVVEHIQAKVTHNLLKRNWQIPNVLLTLEGENHVIDQDNSIWRGISFINDCQCFDTVQNPQHAQEIGYALGLFHTLISDLNIDQLTDTLPGFHITPQYLQHYYQVLAKTQVKSCPEVKYFQDFINQRATQIDILEKAKARRELPLRPIHGDPKVNNIMINCQSGEAIAMIDLDTVKPGLIHYDIGDCLRSLANPLGEETQAWQEVEFNLSLAKAMLAGYLDVARNFLTEYDYFYLYDCIRLIAFELGLRFLSDYLAGNIYFKTNYPEHNLQRALVQFQLAASIEAQATPIRQIIAQLK